MTTLKHGSSIAAACRLMQRCTFVCFAAISGFAAAQETVVQENAIQSISASQQGSSVIIKISLKNPVAKPPVGFSITSPARIALDFSDTINATGASAQNIGLGEVRNVNVVQ